MRYRYIAYKSSRKGGPDTALQSIWESFGAWSVPMTALWRPPTDVYETADEIIVLVEIAGVSETDMSVTLFSDLLVVEGTRNHPEFPGAAMSACHRLGIKYGDFRSEVEIPAPVDHDAVSAEYQNGILRIVFRKIR